MVKKIILCIIAPVIILSLVTAVFYPINTSPQAVYLQPKRKTLFPQILFQQVKKMTKVIWVDGRSRLQWQKDGIANSLFITLDPREETDELIAVALPKLIVAQQQQIPVVIYCGEANCSDGDLLAVKLQSYGVASNIFLLKGGARQIPVHYRVGQK